jgi:hypothetical protein
MGRITCGAGGCHWREVAGNEVVSENYSSFRQVGGCGIKDAVLGRFPRRSVPTFVTGRFVATVLPHYPFGVGGFDGAMATNSSHWTLVPKRATPTHD